MHTIFLVYSDILKSTKTIDQAQTLALEIDILLQSLFHEGEKKLEKALASIRQETAQIIRDQFLNKNLKSPNKEMIKDFLTQLKARVIALKPIKLSIALDPSEITIEHIHDWVLKNIGNNYILDITADKNIIGGASIIFEGKYIDLSLRKQLDEVFKKNRSVILNSFQHL